MKIALCTTTINIPHVLKLYRACDPHVKFFVAIDFKTPVNALQGFDPLDTMAVRGEEFKCSELIGFNSIQRRNLAFLEALKWGADIIVSVDDDNLPLAAPYCAWHQCNLGVPHTGVMVSNRKTCDMSYDWFDVGSLLQPPAKHRGFPAGFGPRVNNFVHTVDAKVGVSAGICLGDPDVDATTRMISKPDVHQVSQLLESGVVVNPHTWTVFNSQNSAMLRELIPAWGMIPFVGRMDDIYASLICQRVMRERDLHVHFGKPFVLQQRNVHDLVRDLRGEIDGYDNVARLADVLDHMVLLGKSVIADCRAIWETLGHADWIPGRSVAAMQAYLDDCEAVL
jgi:hypothetical protein